MRILALLLVWAVAASAGQFDKVKITPDISYIYVYHKGKAVKVHRTQDTKNKLTGEYAKIRSVSRHGVITLETAYGTKGMVFYPGDFENAAITSFGCI